MFTLCNRGFISVVLIDDPYLQGITDESCLENVQNTIELFQILGFTIHPLKSTLTPTQRKTFPGFVIDSVLMTLEITEDKKIKLCLHNLCLQVLLEDQIPITFLVSIIKNFSLSFPAIPSVLFFHRKSENQKIQELKQR